MSSKLQAYKNKTAKKPLDFITNNTECYKEPFSLDELSESLKKKSHDTAVGPDQLHYQILNHLPKSSKECLLQLFNVIWERDEFPVS